MGQGHCVSVCVCVSEYLYLLHIEYQSKGPFVVCVIFLHMHSKQTCWVRAISRKKLWSLRYAVANTSSCVCSQHPTASRKEDPELPQTAAPPPKIFPLALKLHTCISPRLVPTQRVLPSSLQQREEIDSCPDSGSGSKYPTTVCVSAFQMYTEEPSAKATILWELQSRRLQSERVEDHKFC